eukprot:7172534-Karenia_brevis.AAC.1
MLGYPSMYQGPYTPMNVKIYLNATDQAMEQCLKRFRASVFRLPPKDVTLLWHNMHAKVPFGPLQQAGIRPMRAAFQNNFDAAVDVCLRHQHTNELGI